MTLAEAAREAIRAHLHEVLEARRRGQQGATFTPYKARFFFATELSSRRCVSCGSDKRARACGALVFSVVAIDLFRPLKRVATRFLA
jgi:hypothetical protein